MVICGAGRWECAAAAPGNGEEGSTDSAGRESGVGEGGCGPCRHGRGVGCGRSSRDSLL